MKLIMSMSEVSIKVLNINSVGKLRAVYIDILTEMLVMYLIEMLVMK